MERFIDDIQGEQAQAHQRKYLQNIQSRPLDYSDQEIYDRPLVDGLPYPFKRLKILEHFAQKASIEYPSSFEGPKLDNLQHDMIDTGPSKPYLRADGSGSFSFSSSTNIDLGDIRSQSGSSKSGSQGTDKKPFTWRGRKKAKQAIGWDLFPGIINLDLPVSSSASTLASTGPSIELRPPPPTTTAVLDQEKLPGRKPLQGGRRSVDLLSRTFDVQDFEAAEKDGIGPEGCSISISNFEGRPQSTVGGTPLATFHYQDELSDAGSQLQGGPKNCQSVTDTSTLRIQKFKGVTFVNSYAIITTLGSGSFGEVKLALNTDNLEVYALKLISKSRRRKHRKSDKYHVAEAAVMREINVMKELSHPNLNRLVEVIDDPTNHKILMVLEYVEGGSLFAGTRIAPACQISELTARKYFRDVIQGLSYLHANKIAHGDLKPDNFLLATNGHIKIADFGSSQLTRVGDLVNRTAGTPAFMAPEMCGGGSYQARIADVWALGVSLYMFVFGTVPFKSNSIMGLYHNIRNEDLEFPPNIFVSDSIRHLLTGLLDKDPKTRMSLAAVMSHPWVTYNGELPLVPPSLDQQMRELGEEEGLLMESWPNDPEDGILASALRAMAFGRPVDTYPDGTFVVNRGDPFVGIYKLEQGCIEVDVWEEADSDSDEDEEAEGQSSLATERLSMLKLMLDACNKATHLATASRSTHNGKTRILSLRGRGSFIGEPHEMGDGPSSAGWQFSLKARGDVKCKFVSFEKFYDLSSKHPAFVADGRAVMAQRRGEFLQLGMLERLASLRPDLQAKVDSLQRA